MGSWWGVYAAVGVGFLALGSGLYALWSWLVWRESSDYAIQQWFKERYGDRWRDQWNRAYSE